MKLVLSPREMSDLQRIMDTMAVSVSSLSPQDISRAALSNFFVGRELQIIVQNERKSNEQTSNTNNSNG